MNTVKELNAWIDSTFKVLQSSHAYEDFLLHISIGEKDDFASSMYCKRVVHVTLCLSGIEEDCCQEIYQLLYSIATDEERLDRVKLIFIRNYFEYRPAHKDVLNNEFLGGVYGRLCFWDKADNDKLIQYRAYKMEGGLARPAKRQEPK